MKKSILMLYVIVAGLAHQAVAATVEDKIAERIQKVGNVCIEGQECPGAGDSDGAAAADSTASADSGDTGETTGTGDIAATYNKTCANCHDAGVADAPKLGDAEEWEKRLEKGMDTLYASAIEGMPPAMPAKGTCFNCSDEELKALVDYMLEESE